MIRKEKRFDEYAYRVATMDLDESVTSLEEGQWVTPKAGKLVVATGAEKKAFLSIGSLRAGRDQVSGKATRKVSFLLGAFSLSVSNFDPSGTYSADTTALKIKAGGVLTPVSADTDKAVAYAIGVPVNGYLRIIKE